MGKTTIWEKLFLHQCQCSLKYEIVVKTTTMKQLRI